MGAQALRKPQAFAQLARGDVGGQAGGSPLKDARQLVDSEWLW